VFQCFDWSSFVGLCDFDIIAVICTLWAIKKVPTKVCLYLRQILADFKNSFTVTFCGHCKFYMERISDGIFKLGQYFVKICAKVSWHLFMAHSVV